MTDEEIRETVWGKERPRDDSGVPDVGDEEIATLMHRLRHELGEHRGLIRTLRGHGYLLQ